MDDGDIIVSRKHPSIPAGVAARAVPVLDAVLEYVNSVPYKVSLRWVFYRLLQDGYLHGKGEYGWLKANVAAARKARWGGWQPDTLVDHTREVSTAPSPRSASEMVSILPFYASIRPDLYVDCEEVPFILFEAETMTGQFAHVAPWCDRAAFRGDASIPHKWNIAKRCDDLAARHDRPVRVLYAGDFDPKGLQIPESAMADIRAWVNPETDLRFTRIGLSAEQARAFGIPEKPESPGTFEWESLSQQNAASLIREGLATCLSLDTVEARLGASSAATEALQARLVDYLGRFEL